MTIRTGAKLGGKRSGAERNVAEGGGAEQSSGERKRPERTGADRNWQGTERSEPERSGTGDRNGADRKYSRLNHWIDSGLESGLDSGLNSKLDPGINSGLDSGLDSDLDSGLDPTPGFCAWDPIKRLIQNLTEIIMQKTCKTISHNPTDSHSQLMRKPIRNSYSMHYSRYEFRCPCRFEKTLYKYYKLAPKSYEQILQGPHRNRIFYKPIAKMYQNAQFAAATAVLRFK